VRGYGARAAYEAVAAKGDVTASDSWIMHCMGSSIICPRQVAHEWPAGRPASPA